MLKGIWIENSENIKTEIIFISSNKTVDNKNDVYI